MYYLYVKTHIPTGLKYLGYTKNDPYIYKGSGVRWNNHIRKHGYDVWTNVIFQSDSKEEIAFKGKEYSLLWNVVESDDWANLMVEQGDGGDTSKCIDYNKINTDKISRRMTERNKSSKNPFKDPNFQKTNATKNDG